MYKASTTMGSNIFMPIFGPNSCQIKQILGKERIFWGKACCPSKNYSRLGHGKLASKSGPLLPKYSVAQFEHVLIA